MFKKNLKIPKGGSEAVKQIKQWPNEKRKHSQTMIYKALHKKTEKLGRISISCSTSKSCALVIRKNKHFVLH
jgi:hypothetical protein